MARHFVAESVPPQARRILEEKHLQNTPMGVEELWEAFEQAKSNEELAKDPDRRRQILESIRQEYLAAKFGDGFQSRRR